MIFPELMEFLGYFRRDTLLIIGIILAMIFKRSREFIKYWVPFLIFWITYDMMRGRADELSQVHVREIYDLELLLFGWLFDGKIPAFWMKEHTTIWLSSMTAFFYTLHPMVPLWVAVSIFYVSKNKELFKEFSISFLTTSYLALITFVIYPVAPPWYIAEKGFVQPAQRSGLAESAAGLVDVDNFFQTDFYGTVYGTFNANAFAAMPSLHSAYAIISVYYFIKAYKHKSKLVYLSVLYPTAVWFSAVYLQHHYIVDLIAGGLYVLVSVVLTNKLLDYLRNRKKIAEDVVTEDDAEEIQNMEIQDGENTENKNGDRSEELVTIEKKVKK